MSYRIERKNDVRIVGIRTPLVEDAEENMRDYPMWKYIHSAKDNH